MIDFITKVDDLLPYDRSSFSDFWDEDVKSSQKPVVWYAVSFQIHNEDDDVNYYKSLYQPLFESVILRFEENSNWIVNHAYEGFKWFPNNENNLTDLRKLFHTRGVPNFFVGALTFATHDLLLYSEDIITYPIVVFDEEGSLYVDLIISNSEIPFIIKVSAHMNIDFLSTDKFLLRQIINEKSGNFIIKEYSGSLIWE